MFSGQKSRGLDLISVRFLNLTIYFHLWPEKPNCVYFQLQPDMLYCFWETNNRPAWPALVTRRPEWERDIMRKAERERATAEGLRHFGLHAVNKHIVCQHSGTAQQAAAGWGVALFRFNNICSHQQQYKHFNSKGKRSVHAERNTSTEERTDRKNSHMRKCLPAHKSFHCPVLTLHVSVWLGTCKHERSNQGVKHERLMQQLRDLSLRTCGCSVVVSSLTLHHTVQMTVQLSSKVQCGKFPSNLKSQTLRPSTGPPQLHLTS